MEVYKLTFAKAFIFNTLTIFIITFFWGGGGGLALSNYYYDEFCVCAKMGQSNSMNKLNLWLMKMNQHVPTLSSQLSLTYNTTLFQYLPNLGMQLESYVSSIFHSCKI